jgi:hypothetical protein
MESCLRFLDVVDFPNLLPFWGASMSENPHNIRFMGGIYLQSPLWIKLINAEYNLDNLTGIVA